MAHMLCAMSQSLHALQQQSTDIAAAICAFPLQEAPLSMQPKGAQLTSQQQVLHAFPCSCDSCASL